MRTSISTMEVGNPAIALSARVGGTHTTMTPERWQQIKRLCELALEQEPGERAAFLSKACARDHQLREEVEGLLQHATLGPGNDSPIWTPFDSASIATAASFTPPLPQQIGRYRVIRVVGQGGMGTVYEAEQDSPRRRVALKVVRAGRATRELFKRFERESQALGRLQHPGIAQVYEAGTADAGSGPQPYFAMEFIEGSPLKEYVQALDVPARLELIARICDAVQHAHDRGIIHRDIKPGNILVDRMGQPKVVDFGVARLVEAAPSETLHTIDGQLVGTLAYMSPEQVRGDASVVDGRSDVYAIGVLLYELLAGRMPYNVSGPQHEAIRAIVEDDPGRLSTISRKFKGDVETIVAKALEKDPRRRYASAAALATDVRRYLADEPITARPPSAAYQLEKFVRRHTSLVAATAAVFVALSAGTIMSTWQALRAHAAERTAMSAEARATQERDDAVRERNRALTAERMAQQERNHAVEAQEEAQAERGRAVEASGRAKTEAAISKAVQDFLQSDLLAQSSAQQQATPDSKPDPDLKVRTALDRAAARVPERFRGQPLVEASVRQTIGGAYQDLGLYPEARAQFERVVQLRNGTLGASHELSIDALRSVAQDTMLMGKYPEAEALYRQVIDGLTQRHGPTDPLVLSAQSELVELDLQMGRYQAAETLIGKTLDTQRRVLGPDHPSTLTSLSELGRAQISQGNYPAAEATLKTLVASLERTKGPDHPDTLSTKTDLAQAFEMELKFGDAESMYKTALDAERRALGPDHPYTLTTANGLAVMYKKQGKYAQAEPLYTTVVAGRTRVLGPEHPDTLSAMNNLGALYVSEKRFGEAVTLLTQVLATRKRVLGPEHPNTLNTMVNLAQAYRGQGRTTDTEALYAEVVSIRQRTLGPEHPDTLFIMANLGVVYSSEAKYDEAERLLTKVREVRRRTLGDGHPNTAQVTDNLASLYLARGDAARASELYVEVLEARRRALGPDHADTLRSQGNLGESYVQQGDLEKGARLLDETLARARAVLPRDHDLTLEILESEAMVRRRQGRLADARSLMAEALESRRRLLGNAHPYTIEDVMKLGLIVLEQGDYSEAEAIVRPVVTLDPPSGEPWLLYEAKSVLGGSLAAQRRFDEAESQLVNAYDGLLALGNRVPAPERPAIAQTVERLMALYHAWGKEDRAAFWGNRLPRG